MPTSSRDTRPSKPEIPPNLRAFFFHGMELAIGDTHGVGDCPFCQAEHRFSADIDTGQWRCFVCGSGTDKGGGNPLIFIQLLYERSCPSNRSGGPRNASKVGVVDGAAFFSQVQVDRKLAHPGTPQTWGVRPSLIDGSWLLPGYSIRDGQPILQQVYKRSRVSDNSHWGWKLFPTPGISLDPGKRHALHLPEGDYDAKHEQVHICEGPWDGMALWEVASASSLSPSQVLAVPGCNVWQDAWTELCRDKHVTLWFDSDHPRKSGGKTFRSGFDGMYRVARRLSGIAASVRWLRWGKEGYDPEHPSGWDVRDHLANAVNGNRQAALLELINKVEDAPADWFTLTTSPSLQSGRRRGNEVQPCESWAALEAVWDSKSGGALEWRQELSEALAVLLAVCASTRQAGNQLFLDLVGSAGSAKTTLCDGLLVSNHCHDLEHLTGFHSGWKPKKVKKKKEDGANSDSGKSGGKGKEASGSNTDGSGDSNTSTSGSSSSTNSESQERAKDFSLIARINGKTLITPEFDVLRSSPRYQELMGQVRRIFDGKSGATYKNRDEDLLYEALRTPWIRAGTPKMMLDGDQSQLGDRFLRYIINDPPDDQRRAIMRSALRAECRAMVHQAGATAGSIHDDKTRKAYALTGGYVNWLRANIESLLSAVEVTESAEDCFIDLAELSADLRARPVRKNRWNTEDAEPFDSKELPTRLSRQYVRLAKHLAVVLNKKRLDVDILRIIRKIALDTAHGHSLNLVRNLFRPHPKLLGKTYQEAGGIQEGALEQLTGMSKEKLSNYLNFLRRIDVMDFREVTGTRSVYWLLTDRMCELYRRAMER